MADESKVAGVAEAVKAAKGKAAKKRGSKTTAKPHKTPTPRKRKGAKTSEPKAPPKQIEEKQAPTSGQSGPALELSVEGLNSKEAKVFAALNGEGSGVRVVMTITDLAAECFKSRGKKQANSWTRNSLRRLVQGGLVEKVERGKYRVSEAGRKKLARAA